MGYYNPHHLNKFPLKSSSVIIFCILYENLQGFMNQLCRFFLQIFEWNVTNYTERNVNEILKKIQSNNSPASFYIILLKIIISN